MEKLVAEDKYEHYSYEIWMYPDDDYPDTKYYYYKILDIGGEAHFWLNDPVFRMSNEFYDTRLDAIVGAMNHIDQLESGEG